MYTKGTKLYTLGNKAKGEIITWTYLTQDKGTGYHVMKDQGGQYRNFTTLVGFCEHPDLCQVEVFRRKIRTFKNEKTNIVREIERHKKDIIKLQNIIKKKVQRLQREDKKISDVTRHFQYLKDKYPEEFI
jgi:hypothetical protein